MERKYVCIDCGKEFIVESRRATHAKKGNIWVISYRANTIKNNCTFEEIQKLYEALLKLEVNS